MRTRSAIAEQSSVDELRRIQMRARSQFILRGCQNGLRQGRWSGSLSCIVLPLLALYIPYSCYLGIPAVLPISSFRTCTDQDKINIIQAAKRYDIASIAEHDMRPLCLLSLTPITRWGVLPVAMFPSYHERDFGKDTSIANKCTSGQILSSSSFE